MKGLALDSTVSHYRIVSRLGAGGMGEVYLAEDTKLRRKVALKILSADVTKSSDRLRRFEQEAYAASGLSHPNILVIYEIGCEGEMHFIAAEFVEGQTLRERIARGAMPLRDVLDIAVQVTGALAAAHKAGIVHRDIKPENIMVRDDGYVKLLDFGLAKLIEQPGTGPETIGPSTAVHTESGTVMGTVHYMSPEQVRAKELDARSDIFSLGVVLYEMVSGQRPFQGESSGELMASILMREPLPLSRSVADVPAELERIVNRALRKEVDERYQTARDMRAELKTLGHDLDAQARMERLISRDSGGTPHLRTASGITTGIPSGLPAAESVPPSAVRPVSNAEYLVTGIRRHKRGSLLVVAGLILALLGGALALRKLLQPQRPAGGQAMRTVQLTSAGNAQLAAISPDGKYVAYVQGDVSRQSVWIRQATTAGNVETVPPAEAQYWGLTFADDGSFIYYVRAEKEDPRTGVLYQVPVLGGGSRKMLEDVSSPAAISPDGKQVAFMRVLRGQGKMALTVGNLDGASQRIVATVRAAGFLPEHGPSWSPDGARIAFAEINVEEDTAFCTLNEIRLDSGKTRTLTSRRFYQPQQLAWLSDGSGLLFLGQDRPTAYAPQIWYISYADGEARRLTQQLDNYSSISLSRDSSALATVQWRPVSRIWVVPLDRPGAAAQVQSQIGSIDGKYGLSWMPGNRLAFSSFVSGNWVILLSDLDGSNQKQVTFDSAGDYDPSVTGDGRYLVFASNRGGGRGIWRMDLDGGNLKPLTHGSLDWLPNASPDGKWVVFSSAPAGKRTIWKVGIDGGQPVQLTDKLSNLPVFSPDGQWVACVYSDEQRNSPMKIALVPATGGPPQRLLDLPAGAETLIASVRWMPDGQAVVYADTRGGVSNVWSQAINGGPPRQLTNFTSDRILKFDISPDGTRIACARGGNTRDVALITDFR